MSLQKRNETIDSEYDVRLGRIHKSNVALPHSSIVGYRDRYELAWRHVEGHRESFVRDRTAHNNIYKDG